MNFSHNICYLTFLYFLQGWPYGFQARFLPVYFRSHGMSLSSIGFFKLLLVPWMLKALWAPMVDTVGTKRGWLLWSMLGLSVVCYAGSYTSPTEIRHLAVVIFLFNLLTSTQDIAVDGIAIQILSSSELAGGNTAQVVGYKLGAMVGGGLITWLSDFLSWRYLFYGLSLMYFVSIFVIMGFHRVFQIARVSKTIVIESSSRKATLTGRFQPGKQLKQNSQGEKSSPTLQNINTNYNPSDTSEETSTPLSSEGSNASVPFLNTSSSTSLNSSEGYVTPEEIDSEVEAETTEENNFTLMDVARWIQGLILKLLHTEGTGWIIAFVLLYKLGEQGTFNMVPLFLVDQGISVADVGFWLGTVGQAFSIVGSVSGGTSITRLRTHPKKVLHHLFILRSVLLLCMCCLIFAWRPLYDSIGYLTIFITVGLNLAMLTLSGMVTTMTFTLMMRCSQRAPESVQATHYTTLATFEVMGKLTFASVLGWLTEMLGYTWAFSLFATLAVVVIPLLELAPPIVWDSEHDRVKNN